MTDERDRYVAIAKAVRDYDIYASPVWSDLDELSTHTSVDDVEVDLSGIIIEGDSFRGVANVYVTLQYGRDDDEGFHESESFLANFSGRFMAGEPEIGNFSIDTSSRFESENELP